MNPTRTPDDRSAPNRCGLTSALRQRNDSLQRACRHVRDAGLPERVRQRRLPGNDADLQPVRLARNAVLQRTVRHRLERLERHLGERHRRAANPLSDPDVIPPGTVAGLIVGTPLA